MGLNREQRGVVYPTVYVVLVYNTSDTSMELIIT